MSTDHALSSDEVRRFQKEGYLVGDVAFGAAEVQANAVPVELAAGQVMFHHGATPHRTLPNTSDSHRRALAIHYMDATARPLGGNRETEPPENMPVLRSSAEERSRATRPAGRLECDARP